MIQTPPARLDSFSLVLAFHTSTVETVTKLVTIRKQLTYRAAIEVVSARTRYPMAAMVVKSAAKGPRIFSLSEKKATPTIRKKESR